MAPKPCPEKRRIGRVVYWKPEVYRRLEEIRRDTKIPMSELANRLVEQALKEKPPE